MTEQIDQPQTYNENVLGEFRNTLAQFKTIVITGDEGVGKIVHSLAALNDTPNVYFIGNPIDYRGQMRPGGYDQYLDHIRPLKADLTIIATETGILGLSPTSLAGGNAILLVDEVYGRSDAQRSKLYELISADGIKTVIVTGCMKNLHALIELVEAGLMLTGRSALFIEGNYIKQLCRHIRPETTSPDK